jgi:thioredoxin reductase (NADPH)
MPDVAVIGGGPAGLSAALFTAKNDLDTVVFDTDKTALHYAHLFNYLGLVSADGEEFVETGREQLDNFGATRIEAAVESVSKDPDGFTVRTEDGEERTARYLVLATGQQRALADDLGCERNDDGTVVADRNGRTSVEGVYAAGWIARKDKVQAAISVGDGAAAALDILSAEKGKPFHDFDTPEDV